MIISGDIRKCMWVKLRNGFSAKIVDDLVGDSRLCYIYGKVRETKSVYCHDMIQCGYAKDDISSTVVHSKRQLELKNSIKAEEV